MHRLMYFISTIGVVLSTHFYIQVSRGFSHGCWGVKPVQSAAEIGGCVAATGSKVGSLFGLSNVAVGFWFYVVVALLTLGVLFLPEAWRKWMRNGRIVAIVLGFSYSLFLTIFQLVSPDPVCTLCLISFGITAALFGLEVRGMIKRNSLVIPELSGRYVGSLLLLTFFSANVLVADLVLVNKVGASSGVNPDEVRYMVGQALSENIDSEWLQKMSPCKTTPVLAPDVDLSKEVSGLPFLGNPNAKVEIVELFDPNCPHCAHLHNLMTPIIQKYGAQIKFVMVPVPLWDRSVNQVAAILSGKNAAEYYGMIDLQLKSISREGISDASLLRFAKRLGMNVGQLDSAFKSGSMSAEVYGQRKFFSMLKLRGVPAVYINGKPLSPQSYSEACISKLIQKHQ